MEIFIGNNKVSFEYLEKISVCDKAISAIMDEVNSRLLPDDDGKFSA